MSAQAMSTYVSFQQSVSTRIRAARVSQPSQSVRQALEMIQEPSARKGGKASSGSHMPEPYGLVRRRGDAGAMIRTGSLISSGCERDA